MDRAILMAVVLTGAFLLGPIAVAEEPDESTFKKAVDRVLEQSSVDSAPTAEDDKLRKDLQKRLLEDAQNATVEGPVGEILYPTSEEIEDAAPEGAVLTGREIYEKILGNRQLQSAIQYQRVVSTDPGGGSQEQRLWVRWKDFRDETGKPVDGVAAKAVGRVLEPPDTRGTTILIIVNEGGTNDQFVYQPSTRRVRRVRLDGGVGVGGTDFSIGDVAFTNIEAADYERASDEEINGLPVYVVTAIMKPFINSDFRTVRVYAEKEHYVVLRALYMDDNGVELRELTADANTIGEYNDLWLATDSKTKNLKEGTTTHTFIEKIDPNVELADKVFSMITLQMKKHN